MTRAATARRRSMRARACEAALEPACPREQAGEGHEGRPKLLLPFTPRLQTGKHSSNHLQVGPKALTPPFETALPAAIPGPPHLGRGWQFLHQRQGQNLLPLHDCPSAGLWFRQGSLSFTFFTHMTAPRRNHITDAIHSKET